VIAPEALHALLKAEELNLDSEEQAKQSAVLMQKCVWQGTHGEI